MTWFKVDDQFPDHPKVVAAGGDAGWLFVCGGCYCARHLTDGMIPKAAVGRLTDRKQPMKLAAVLVEAGLWHDHGDSFEVHGYLDYNPSREKVLTERQKASERRANGARASAERRATEVREAPAPDPTRPDLELQEPVELALDVPECDPVSRVFEVWQEATGHHRAVLDKKRRACIKNALKDYGVEELEDACRGVTLVPHNRGETNGTVYDDLTLVLRDSEHIERFRDQARAGPAPPKGAGGLMRAAQRRNGAIDV